MNKKNDGNSPNQDLTPTLKVVHKKTGTVEVLFPFTEVPVEMTRQYFEKNIDLDQYIVDLDEDLNPPIAG